MILDCRQPRVLLLCLCMLTAIAKQAAIAADAIPGEELCDRPVERIHFHGNKVTKRHVLLREVLQKEGAACSLDDVVDSTQAILNLGLFRSVVARFENRADQLQLHFDIREKYALLVIPRFSRTSDAELRTGLQVRWDNVGGRLHQMKLTAEQRRADDGDGNQGFVYKLAYTVPRFLGTDIGMAAALSTRRQQVDFLQDDISFGLGNDRSRQLDFSLSRWASNTEGVSGLRYFGGFQITKSDLSIEEGYSGPFVGGRDINLVLGWENSNIQVDAFRRRGDIYGASIRFANRETHSDFEYVRLDAFWRRYIPLSGDTRNLNLQFRVGLSDGAPFGRRAYSIGGGEILRGLPPGTVTGDILVLANVEYLSAFAGYEQWRWVLFADIGNTYKRNSVNLRQKLRVGAGLRRKIRALSNTDLRLDVAWDSSAGRLRSFFSTNLTF